MSLHGHEIVDPLYYERFGYPHPAWAWLRRHEPVSWHEPEGMKPFWAITKHADLELIARDTKRFTIAKRTAVWPEEEYPTDDFPYRHLLTMDPPEHGKYRGILTRHFSAKLLEQKRPAIAAIVDGVFDRIADRREIDFVESVSMITPLQVVNDMLGCPREDWDWLFRVSNVLVGASDPEITGGLPPREAMAKALGDVFAYFRKLSDERRGKTGDDFITLLANAEVDGDSMRDRELMSYYVLLIVAGNETTRNATTGGLQALIENPGEMAKLRSDPGLVPSAVEEIVRWVSPVVQFVRTPLEDVEVRGVRVPAGDSCCLFYPSANRDEEVFREPFSFRVDREENEHCGFGIGVHFCLGANLARIQLQEIFKRVIARMDEIELAGKPERVRSSFVGGVKRMPVRFRTCG